MERNTIIIISIIEIFAICALIISILGYTQSINTRGDIFTGKVVDDNGKQIKMNDWLNNDIGKDFMKKIHHCYCTSSFPCLLQSPILPSSSSPSKQSLIPSQILLLRIGW